MQKTCIHSWNIHIYIYIYRYARIVHTVWTNQIDVCTLVLWLAGMKPWRFHLYTFQHSHILSFWRKKTNDVSCRSLAVLFSWRSENGSLCWWSCCDHRSTGTIRKIQKIDLSCWEVCVSDPDGHWPQVQEKSVKEPIGKLHDSARFVGGALFQKGGGCPTLGKYVFFLSDFLFKSYF